MTDGLDHLGGSREKPIAELLVYVGLELRSLCSAAYQVENAVAELIADPDAHQRDGLKGIQELDRLIQHMDGLADYLGALSEATAELGAIDPTEARKVLKLARLAQGLAGDAGEDWEKKAHPGEFELL